MNKACPIDDSPIPHSNLLVDDTMGFKILTYMDGYSGCSQVKLHLEYEKIVGFCSPTKESSIIKLCLSAQKMQELHINA